MSTLSNTAPTSSASTSCNRLTPIPAAPIIQNAFAPYNFDGHGATEFYGVYRGTLSGNALTHSKMFTFSPIFIKDISIEYGADGEFQNVAISPNKRLIVGGIQFAFDVPGFLTRSAFMRRTNGTTTA